MREMRTVPYSNIRITGGFWGERRRIGRERTLMAIYDRFAETGRFASLDFAWKPGEPNCPHIFWDSDIAKWIESAAYLLKDERDEKIEALVDACVDKIEAHQWADGYFNIHFGTVEPENRFTRYTDHELYDLGHLIEAAVAWRHATGRDRFLKIMCRYADYIDRVFRQERSAAFTTPGHEEIELALIKLYHATGEARYLDLARFFIDQRGANPETEGVPLAERLAMQSHMPVRAMRTARVASVRMVLQYCSR